jgi:hypothetical protein
MRQLSIGEKKHEISEEDYLTMLRELAKGNCDFAETIHNYHASGFSDWKNTFKMGDAWNNDIAIALIDQIDDGELSKEFELLINDWKDLQEVDSQITVWLAEYVGLSTINDKKGKVKLARKLHKITINGPNGRTQGPIWLNEPAYQALISKSRTCLVCMQKAENKIIFRIKRLLRSAKVT